MFSTIATINPATQENWLTKYYYARGTFNIAWIVAVLALATRAPAMAAILLVAYPAWDALANLVDGTRSGGVRKNPTQAINVVASLAIAGAVAIALPDMHHVLAVFGVWAILSGLLQLSTGVRRWKANGAQWAMILSGAQSAVAGAAFIFQAQATAVPSITTLVGYAGFGAFYFLVSAVSLSVREWRGKRA